VTRRTIVLEGDGGAPFCCLFAAAHLATPRSTSPRTEIRAHIPDLTSRTDENASDTTTFMAGSTFT
jgi:hypothetical protein